MGDPEDKGKLCDIKRHRQGKAIPQKVCIMIREKKSEKYPSPNDMYMYTK